MVQFILARLKEPSTYAGLSGLAVALGISTHMYEAAAAAVAPTRPTAAHPQPAPVQQGPWPPAPSRRGRFLAASARLPQGPFLPEPRGGEDTPCCCPAPWGSGSGG